MENANVKLTKAQKFGMLVELLASYDLNDQFNDMFDGFTVSDAKEFLNHEIDLLNKKAGSKKAKATDEMKAAIVAVLTDELQSGAAVLALIADQFEDATQAKVTARLSALVRDGLAAKEEVRVGKSRLQHYRLIGEVAE